MAWTTIGLVTLSIASLGTIPLLATAADSDTIVQYTSKNVNVCPTGFTKPTTSSECRAALEHLGVMGDTYGKTEDDSDWPGGCYFAHGESWFNTNSGKADSNSKLICVKNLNMSPDILHMGDSDNDYWASTSLYSSLGKTSQNVGYAGYTCKNVLKEIDTMLSDFNKPDWVVLVCGENDLMSASVETTFSRFKSVVEKATAAGARVVYMGTKDEPDSKSLWAKYEKYDTLVFNYASGLATTAAGSGAPPPLVAVDVNQAFINLGNPNSFYMDDKLHLSSTGYSYWNTWAVTAVGAVGGTNANCWRWLSNACVNDDGNSGGSVGNDDNYYYDDSTCKDESAWYKKGSPKKRCDWVANNKFRRCNKKGQDGRKASVACKKACGRC